MCEHVETRFYRHPWSNGKGFHVAEHCTKCGVNVRGGSWVPQYEFPAGTAKDLPIWQETRGDQSGLFSDG